MDSARRYDYIVVGAGTAGSVIAARLTEDPDISVLLLEAGPHETDERIARPAAWTSLVGSELDWNYRTTPQRGLADRSLTWPRGRVVGGSGAINAMVHIRGADSDFDAWSRWGGESWNADHMRSWLQRLEGPADTPEPGRLPIAENVDPHPFATAFVTAAQKYGIPYNPDFNTEGQEGVGLYRTTRTSATTEGPARRGNTAHTHLRPALGRPNLTLVADATVLEIDVRGGRARGVRVRHQGRTDTVSADREVVLCGGTVASPRLLLLSGIGPATELASLGITPVMDLPGVGGNLHDHIQVSLSYDTRYGSPVSDHSNLGEAGGFVTVRSGSLAPDVQLSFAPMKDLNNASRLGHGFTIGPAVTRPRSRGRLTLTSADVDAAPIIDPGYLTDPHDLDILVEGVQICRSIAETDPLAGLRTPFSPTTKLGRRELEEFVRTNAQTQFHPVGTCRFGPEDDRAAVTDTRLHVRGVTGLRVADASVIPNMITGNIHAAVAVIAERAAEFITKEHT